MTRTVMIVVWSCIALAPLARAQNGVVVKYGLKSTTISLGEPLILTFTVSNRLASATSIDFGPDFAENLAFSIRDPSGSVKNVPRIWRGDSVSAGRVDLEPNGEWSGTLALSEWLEPSTEGGYTIEVHLRNPEQLVQEQNTVLELSVEPFNRSSLVADCAKLAQTAIRRETWRSAEQAAKALSFVNDPACLSAVKLALRATESFDPFLIRGLERASSPEATLVLAELTSSDRQDRALLARAALHRKEVVQQK
jgi:hypothetical protein